MSASDPDLDYVTQLIEQDLSLSYKLLKLINSPAYRPVKKIKSIKQAVVRVGCNELEKWLYILAIRGHVSNQNDRSRELSMNSLTRAKMCELIALRIHNKRKAPSFFLTGMFSLMDALLGMKMEKVLSSIPLQKDICEALKGKSNEMKNTLELSISIEKGEWENVDSWCKTNNIDDFLAFHCYNEALRWSQYLMKTESAY